MNRTGGKFAAVASAARVGREVDGDSTPRERRRERLRRKQMSAGAAGGQEHDRRAGALHQAALPAGAS